MKTVKRILCFVMVVVMISAVMPSTAEAATKIKLNKKKVTLTITNSKKNPTTTLKVKGVSKKVAKKAKWSTSNKKVATVKKGKVTAKKAGKATITCKVKGKKYTCKVTVVDNRTDSSALKVSIKKASDTEYSYISKPDANPMKAPEVNPTIDTWYASNLNKITIKYNGKDITKNVQFEIDDPYGASWDDETTIDKNGIIWLRHLKSVKVTILYKGLKKTITLNTKVVTGTDYVCYCGEKFDSSDEWTNHRMVNSKENGHDGWYVCPYAFVDVVKDE